MKKIKFNTVHKKLLADTYTPVSMYLKLRDKFPNSILLESSDYHGNENSFSFICCSPLGGIRLENNILTCTYPDGQTDVHEGKSLHRRLPSLIGSFAGSFEQDGTAFSFPSNGLFGYTAYDAVRYFEDIELNASENPQRSIPDMIYHLYRYVIVMDHFRDELYLFDHHPESTAGGGLDLLESLISNKTFASYRFKTEGTEASNFTDDEYMNIVSKGKAHCRRGDVFQVVFSREFSQAFSGDEFNVYRALRSVNPSPYLFYFDYGNFKVFGSSPEAQLIVKDRTASIHPIAGTFKRTGDDRADLEMAGKLKLDPKENAEHVMLVDLARNDLSRDCQDVEVETFREVQYYSHVIHLVSKVTGHLQAGKHPLDLVADTFPAGTLSGAPKHKAMQLIDRYEKCRRGFYGGCIGLIGFNGDFNHAIIIRSFLSKDKRLFYQAGAGVVASSSEQSELNEVNNKLAALKKALQRAGSL
ncbi:MAG TPA: anthranilate synthase component I family protein [Bacteroidia bacterium]|nr:anthranilate synthase component I family protein [Bacteroidia bacterium]